METQLVRLDKPYNIIYGSNGKISLHIATLIVINEEKVDDAKKGVVSHSPVVNTYPVVGGGYGFDGEVWMKSELKDCLLICREGENVGLYALKRSMEFCSKTHHTLDYLLMIPGSFSFSLLSYGSKLILPLDDNKCTISDYVVCLEFSEYNDGKSCTVYADKDSDFYFYDFFDKVSIPSQLVHTISACIKYLAELRDSYLRALKFEGLRSITFTTNDDSYQWFIDKLNSVKIDATGV